MSTELRICANCAHYEHSREVGPIHRCKRSATEETDVVTGLMHDVGVLDCRDERNKIASATYCGIEGRFFRKSKTTKIMEIRGVSRE